MYMYSVYYYIHSNKRQGTVGAYLNLLQRSTQKWMVFGHFQANFQSY